MLETTHFIQHFPYLGILILLLLGNIGLPFPEDATLILSGFLIAQGITQPLPTLLVIYLGLLITDFSLYWIGKKYGRRVVEHKRFHRILSVDRLSKIEEKFRRWGIFVVFFGRHLIGVRAQIFLVAGTMRMPTIRFLMADAASAVFTVTLMVGIGYLGGSRIQGLEKDITKIATIAVLLLIVGLVSWIVIRYSKYVKKILK
jgi:membrane protein DedA with SNARE-associated domain